MNHEASQRAQSDELDQINLYCARDGEAWRVYVEARALLPYLDRYFDEYGEAYPALLDFDDLDRYMAAYDAAYTKHVTATGSVELSAQGEAAAALSEWLSRAFSSCVRPRKK
jgi:hypothetical protein